MRPRRKALIRTLRTSAAMAVAQTDRPELLSLLGVIDVCANELMLREQPAFYLGYYREACDLIERGRLLPGVSDPGQPASAYPQFGDNPHPDLLDLATESATEALEGLATQLAGSGNAAVRQFLADVSAWELRLYAHRLTDGGGKSRDSGMFTRDAFEAYLRDRWPEWTDLKLTQFRMIPGGFSKFTLLFETEDGVNGAQQLVARVEPPVKFMELDGMDIRNEFPVVLTAFCAGLPVAEPLWLEADEGRLGRRFFVSRKVAGEVYGTAKGGDRELPEDVVRMLAQAMARIHSTPLDPHDPLITRSHLARWLAMPDMRANTLGLVDYWAGQIALSGVEPSPIVAQGIAWLRTNVPDDELAPCLIHGDVGLHNMMIADGRLVALLDWENSRAGDPAEDFAMLFATVGDKIDRSRFMQMYHEAGGPPISDYRLRYFDAYGAMFATIGAQATLARLDRFEQANVAWSLFGLQFTHHYASSLPGLIERAEAVR
jgi:aminoglycoside phosphotransferase (APT) family kinase protein